LKIKKDKRIYLGGLPMKNLNQLFATILFLCSLYTLNNYPQALSTTIVTGHVYAASNSNNDTTNTPIVNAVVTAVSTPATKLPTKYELSNNYPNPFNPGTIISFNLPMSSHVRLEIYNILGQKVAELVNKQMDAGSYNITFNAGNLSSGVYLYRLEANNFTSTKKMILTK
jgi:hypothetical protein